MKPIFLAAAALIAVPALAQTTPATTMPDAAAPATPADTANPPGTTMQAPATTDAMPMAQAGTTNPAGDPVGGYQPAMAPMSGTAAAGVTPVFQAAPSPDQAYPAPAPMAKYPICKKGEFDNCMQGPGSTHSREVRGRRSG